MKPKTFKEFQDTLQADTPPSFWSEALRAMWYDLKGNWNASHNIAQDLHTMEGSWIHGYLHRQEGDKFNAGYWYRRAGRDYPKVSLEEERQIMVTYFLRQ
ncbi:hypothetical protein HCG49_05220 [Arenibacter sp. 6A1]|uniref:hypothetical protein n=1 Tax=Arenibacter sp. 6A1 TaxID=2720391 RepID=UPI0014477215|nr:hypothetical protein [Arenibacter sp. 6A1]NKI25956.1 hypothetical protein [Arenibacter sp. 6A1]